TFSSIQETNLSICIQAIAQSLQPKQQPITLYPNNCYFLSTQATAHSLIPKHLPSMNTPPNTNASPKTSIKAPNPTILSASKTLFQAKEQHKLQDQCEVPEENTDFQADYILQFVSENA
ncbi:hypothetical protein LOZ10_006848, partial [Ophidiomyces ophidiicola]